MLVDSENSILAGREIWGYPKEKGQINFIKSARGEVYAVEVNGGQIRFDTYESFSPSFPLPPFSGLTVSLL